MREVQQGKRADGGSSLHFLWQDFLSLFAGKAHRKARATLSLSLSNICVNQIGLDFICCLQERREQKDRKLSSLFTKNWNKKVTTTLSLSAGTRTNIWSRITIIWEFCTFVREMSAFASQMKLLSLPWQKYKTLPGWQKLREGVKAKKFGLGRKF